MEMVPTQETALAASSNVSFGRNVDASDILIPKIYLCQPTSDFGEIPQGHLVRSTDKADLGKELNIIPICFYKTWTNFALNGAKPLFVGTEPYTSANANLPWEYTRKEDNMPMRRDLVFNLYAIISDDVDREKEALSSDDPDPDDVVLPVVLSFSRTSYPVAKSFATFFSKIEKFRSVNPKVSLYPNYFTITSELQTSDKGKWYTWAIKGKDKTTTLHRTACAEWHKLISGGAKVHEVDDSGNEAVEVNDVSDSVVVDESTPAKPAANAKTQDIEGDDGEDYSGSVDASDIPF